MYRKSKLIAILLVLGSFIITTEPVYADDNHAELMDFSLITNLNQTIGKDALSLVDESRLDILGSPDLYFTWSPDGTRMLVVAFISVNTKGKGDSSATLGNVRALYMVNGDGSGIKRISWGEITPYTVQMGEHKLITIQDPSDPTGGASSWSPTGNGFSYTERSGGNARFGGGSHSLFVVDAKNLNLIVKKSLPIEQGPILEWSPKEDSLLYLGLDEQYKPTVFLFDLTKNVSDELPITKYRTAPFNSNDLVWSPDGRKIGFEGNGGLFVLDIDTREVKNLFSTENNIIINRNAFWSPDSSRLIITEIKSTGRADSPIYDVYVIDAINSKSNKLISFESGVIQGWFPGSDRILYVAASKASTNSKDYTLYSMPVEGGDATPLFSSPDDPTSFFAHINPSGKFIGVMLSGADYLMNKDGSNKMQLNIYVRNKYVRGIIWHGRDELLLKMVNENQSNALAIINASTKQIRHIPLPDPYIDKVSWSPTGRYLIARTFKPKTSKPDGYSDYEYHDYLLELPEYDRPMRIEINGNPLVGTDVNISVKSASGEVDNTTIMANGELIGTTNEKGVITHRFDETGEVQLRAVKDGYSTASRTITAIDHIDKRQDPTSKGTTTASVPAADGTGVPGFTATAALVGLISTLLCFHLKSKRK